MIERVPMRGGLRRFAEGGVGVNKKNTTFLPAAQAQKLPLQPDPRGQTGTQEWFENYGAGPEHLFLGDRTLPTVGPFANPSGMPPPSNPSSGGLGDYIPLVGMGAIVGKDLWDWYKNKKGGTLDPELARQVESGALDTSAMNDWILKDLNSSSERMPMPYMYEDGTVGYIGGGDQFWKNMDVGARDISDISAWNEQQLNEYGQNMEMPTLNIDPSAWDRLSQGAGGAFDLYGGYLQGGIEGTANMLSGAGNLYGSLAGSNAYSDALGSAGGTLGGLGSIYGGIQQGGAEGYTQALGGAAQTAQSLGYGGSGWAGGLGTAAGVAGGALAAYGAYESAKVGDKKGAVSQGAAAGAAIGSVVPVIGTAVGAVIGAAVGLIGASLGDKEQASELAYGAHKKLNLEDSIRGWTPDQVGGAVFETIKSHTKSGNINKFPDVSEMYTAMGITKDAHKNYKTVQSKMDEFIKGTIETAIGMGALPSDPAQLRQLDGQEFFQKVVTPALAEKYKEATGKTSQGWTADRADGKSLMHNLFADWTDYIFANWQKSTTPSVAAPSGGGRNHVLERNRGGLASFNEGGMVPRRGGLSLAIQPRSVDSTSYYRYGLGSRTQQSQQSQSPMNSPLPRAMGGLAMYGFNEGGAPRLVRGPGTGRSDDIPAVLSDGEYVIDAETVALLGDGSTDEGARRLDALRKKLRMQKGKQLAKGQFSSAAKNPEEYL